MRLKPLGAGSPPWQHITGGAMKPYSARWLALAVVVGALLFLDACFNVQVGIAQSKDPFLGVWILDADKSQFVPGPAPEDRKMIFEAKENSIRHTTKTLNAFLSTTDDIDYTARFDGKDYPITGTGLDTVSLKRIDANTFERTGKVRGKVTETGTMKVSGDGKVLTVTIKGSYNGADYSSVQILTRE
jgi:hypothetical protein